MTPADRAAELARRQQARVGAAVAAADQRMSQAKARFSLAALACLRQAPDASELVAKALGEVDGARAALRALEAP